MRPKDNDTVSEAQAYAMLRAVWMNDKQTFDSCYRWSEENLSRNKLELDNLLSWQWKEGEISDPMPAADADIDYALGLIFAHSLWGASQPEGLMAYAEKASVLLDDILKNFSYRSAGGKLYLAPWILGPEALQRLPVNPSYYSPGHFKIFYQFSQDKRWLELVETTYFMLDTLSANFNSQKGVGLIPDWCSVDNNDRFYPLEGKDSGFGWEAVRIPFRVGLDYFWFEDKRAAKYLDRLSLFIERELEKQAAVFCEYDYTGTPVKRYESPLFYAAYFWTLLASGSPDAESLLNKTNTYIRKTDNGWVYLNEREYFVNSLAWFSDGIDNGIISNLFESSLSDR